MSLRASVFLRARQSPFGTGKTRYTEDCSPHSRKSTPHWRTAHTCPPTRFASGTIVAGSARECRDNVAYGAHLPWYGLSRTVPGSVVGKCKCPLRNDITYLDHPFQLSKTISCYYHYRYYEMFPTQIFPICFKKTSTTCGSKCLPLCSLMY
jgi:hypothetical protein